jgi:hypothetical protein
MKRPKNQKLPRGIFRRKDRDDGWYYVRYFDRHAHKHVEKASPTLEGAKAALEKRRTEIREGKFFPEKVKQRSVLFREIAQEYLAKVRQGRKRDKAHDEQRVPVLVKALKDVPVDEVTPGGLDSVLDGLAKEYGWLRSTQNRYRSVLSGIFRQAIRDATIRFNPVRETTHYPESERVRYLREGEDQDKDEEARLMKVVRSRRPNGKWKSSSPFTRGCAAASSTALARCRMAGSSGSTSTFGPGSSACRAQRQGRSRARFR